MNDISIPDNKTDLIQTSWNSLSRETQKAYQIDLEQFAIFSKKKIADITPADVSRYIAHLRGKELKNATINRKIASISKMFTVYVQAGMIQVNPVSLVRTLQKTNYKTQRNVKSPIEFDQLKEALDNPDCIKDRRTVLIVKFLGRSGCRISEALTAKRSDIIKHSKKSDKIRVMGKGQKERFVYLDHKLKKEIFKYYDYNKSDLLFPSIKGNIINRTYFWAVMVEFFNRKTGLHVNPHKMRHFFATYKIYVEKMDVKSVSQFLGHSSTAITQDMYVDTVLSEKDAEVNL